MSFAITQADSRAESDFKFASPAGPAPPATQARTRTSPPGPSRWSESAAAGPGPGESGLPVSRRRRCRRRLAIPPAGTASSSATAFGALDTPELWFISESYYRLRLLWALQWSSSEISPNLTLGSVFKLKY